MSNIQNDAKKAVSDVKEAVTAERRRLATRLLVWLQKHTRTMVAIIALLVIFAVAFGFVRG